MDTFESIARSRVSAAPARDTAATTRSRDEQTEGTLLAIRAAGGDREAAISAGHRALARAVTTR
jgi:hypothetical protein